MIIRKPTKVELKPEEDMCEYDEYKRKQSEQIKNVRPQNEIYQPMKQQNNRMISEKLLSESFIGGGNFNMNMSNEGVINQHQSNTFSNQTFASSQANYDPFANFQRQLVQNDSLDLGTTPEPRTNEQIQQLFSMLLNNLGQSPQHNPSSLNNST